MTPKTVAVVGLGYVGLPLAILAKEKDWEVVGIDVDEQRVETINRQISPLSEAAVAASLKKYPITATTDFSAIATAEVIVIAVPTPVTDDKLPDLTPLTGALRAALPHLSNGQTIIIESTINPGVMEEIVLPLLRERAEIQLEDGAADSDSLAVAHCPERINPGDEKWTVRNIPRVVGGCSPGATRRAKAFYDSIIEADILPMADATEAEAVKILENTFRDVNIAFINEMAKSFAKLNIDIMHVIAGAATKPFAFLPHYPGNGVGGHCISVDPYYMIERGRQAGFEHAFLKLARDINNSMPDYTVSLLETGFAQQNTEPSAKTVAVLGLAYKRDVNDLRESPALDIVRLLEEKGIPMVIFDPFVPERSTVNSLSEALAAADAVLLCTNHTEFIDALTATTLAEAGIALVVDGKNALDADAIAAAGIPYYGIGRMRQTAPAAE